MAKPIKETPVLRRVDAKNFRREMEANKDKSISPAEALKIRADYEKIRAISKF